MREIRFLFPYARASLLKCTLDVLILFRLWENMG